MEQLREATAADGTTLRYEYSPPVAGSGAADSELVPVLFLHGSLSNHHAFRKVRVSLGSRPLVLTILRGHDGDDPVVGPDYSLAGTEVVDVLAVLGAEGIQQVDVMAHSTGGSIALALAARHPQRVRRIVLIEPTLLPLLEGPVAERVRSDVAEMVATATAGEQLRALRLLLDFVGGGAWRNAPEEARQRIMDTMAALAPLVGPHVAALAELAVTASDLRRLAAPTLLIYGTDSAYFEPAIAQLLARLRPDLRQLHVDGAGHNAHLEQPDLVGPAAAGFLDATD
ncbi:MAG: alpha/beta fold hydrolase [Acidimicrobiales bacterium]